MFKFSYTNVFLSFAVAVCLTGSINAEETIENGSFENELKGWNWTIHNNANAECAVIDKAAHSGTHCLRLTRHTVQKPKVAAVLSQMLKGLEPGAKYTVSAWFRGTDIGQAWVGLNWGHRGAFWLGNINDWTRMQTTFTVPENGEAELMIALDGWTEELLVDDIEIARFGDPEIDSLFSKISSNLLAMGQATESGKFQLSLSKAIASRREKANVEFKLLLKQKKDLDDEARETFISSLKSLLKKTDGLIVSSADVCSDIRPAFMPDSLEETGQMAIMACVNEFEVVALNISNITATSKELQVFLGPVTTEAPAEKRYIFDYIPDAVKMLPITGIRKNLELEKNVKLRKALFVRRSNGDFTADALADFFPGDTVFIPAGETRQILLECNTRNITPGKYFSSLSLVPMDRQAPIGRRDITLSINVCPFTLREKAQTSTFCFDYGLSLNPSCLRDLQDARTNIINVPIRGHQFDKVKDLDLKCFDPYVELHKKFGLGLMLCVWFLQENKELRLTDEHCEWFGGLFGYLKESGVPAEKIILEIYDETLCDNFLYAAKVLKERFPDLRIFADPYQSRYTLEDYRNFLPHVNVMCPKLGLLLEWQKERPEIIKAIRDSGVELWAYRCNSGKENEVPVEIRVLPWRAIQFNLDGISRWTYSVSDCPDDWVPISTWSSVYGLPDGTTMMSRRWLAWRDGIEDMVFVQQLKEIIRDEKILARINAAVLRVTENSHSGRDIDKERLVLLKIAAGLARDL